jgi:hypothetical protein
VRYATAAAFRQALDHRLKTEAARTGLPLARLRKQVAFELFLRRLVAVAPGRWVLTGALALELRLKATTRPTRDIDLGRDDDEQAAIEDITAVQQLALDDFFTYTAIRTDDLDRTDEFTAVRFHVTAQLAGRTFDQFALDIVFTDSIPAMPDTITTSDLLDFAESTRSSSQRSRCRSTSQRSCTPTRAPTDRQDVQAHAPKDLVDILLIAHSEPIDARALRTALEATFAERSRQPLPARLPPPPTAWTEPYQRLAAEVDIEPNLDAAFARAAAFLDPVLADRSDGTWEPRRRTWA